MRPDVRPNEKWMKSFDQRIRAARDAARGIPEAHITEVESAARRVEKALLGSNDALRRAAEEQWKLHDAANAENEKYVLTPVSPQPLPSDIAQSLAGRFGTKCNCECTVRDFVLPFLGGRADPDFHTQPGVTTVQQGIVGWGDFAPPQPHLANTGAGSGQLINGNLDLYWSKPVPHDGIFALNPSQRRSEFFVFGSHRVRGQGWALSSNDSRVEVEAWVIVYLDGEWIDARHYPVSHDATRSENRTRNFSALLDLPGRIAFQAHSGQELGMIVRLFGSTWANDEGTADVWISSFGLPSNQLSDMDIDVLD